MLGCVLSRAMSRQAVQSTKCTASAAPLWQATDMTQQEVPGVLGVPPQGTKGTTQGTRGVCFVFCVRGILRRLQTGPPNNTLLLRYTVLSKCPSTPQLSKHKTQSTVACRHRRCNDYSHAVTLTNTLLSSLVLIRLRNWLLTVRLVYQVHDGKRA